MAGQADEAPTTDDLAQFLMDTPETEPDEQEDELPEAPDEDNAEEDESPDEDESDEDESEKPESQPSNRTFKVTVKGEDGADQEVEVPETELIAGYQRHADYTRKTMELGEREREAARVVSTKLEESRNHYMQQVQMAHALVQEVAGIRTPQEMAYLAQHDPAQWAQEKQRIEQIQGVMQRLGSEVHQQQSQAQQQHAQQIAHAKQQAELELVKEGVTRDDVLRVYGTMQKTYGVSPEALGNITDAKVFRIMRDAAAYRDLQAKKPTPAAKTEAKPKLPAARQTVPSSVKSKALDQKFRTGRAGVKDLASFILQNSR